jgi:hypothetical protein
LISTIFSFLTHPKKLLLFDALGALVTALTIHFVLAGELVATGVPSAWLRVLALIGLSFVCFDLWAYRFLRSQDTPLFTIAGLNVGYCILAAIVLTTNSSTVAWLGWFYFCMELGIIAILAAWEFTVARRVRRMVKSKHG